MTWRRHVKERLDVYLLIASWVLVGANFPGVFAVIYAALSFLLVMRTQDLTKIFLAFASILIFGDSRSMIFSFAETAKIVFIVMMAVFLLLNYSRLEIRKNDLFKFFLPFLLYALLASAWSQSPFTAFQKSLSYGLIFFVVPLFYLNGRKENRWFGVELIFFFATMLAVGLLIHLIDPTFTTLVQRYRGLLGNPNGLGIFLTVMFAVVYPIYRRNKEVLDRNRFMYLFYALFILSVLMTGSRTALIAIALFFIFNQLRYLSNAFTILIFFSLVASYEYLLLQLPRMVVYLGLEEYFRLDTLEEGSGRFVAWNFAWQRIQEVFFVGGGFGNTEYVFGLFYDELSRLGHQGNAHNSYLTLWLDTGVVGIFLFSFGLIRSILVALKNSPYTLPVVFSVLFSTYFESWLSASLNPFTTFFLVSLTILALPEKQEIDHV